MLVVETVRLIVSLGAYGTYFDNSGYYVDAVVKANRFKTH